MNKKIPVIAASAAAAAASAVAGAFALDKTIKTTEYALNTGKAKEPFTVTVVSDLHFARFGKDNSRLIEKVRQTNPDLILMPGDFFDYKNGKSNRELVVKTMESLAQIAPAYFSPGNHDKRYDARTGEVFADCIKDTGVTLLDGDYVDITVKNTPVRIAGIYDFGAYEEDYHNRWEQGEVYALLKKTEQTDAVKLLILHRPNTFIYTNEEWDIDAVFCGHTHGGLWQLPLIGGVYAPEQNFFPKYDKGEFDFGKMKMFISAGMEGYSIAPRLFNPPEILKITIN